MDHAGLTDVTRKCLLDSKMVRSETMGAGSHSIDSARYESIVHYIKGIPGFVAACRRVVIDTVLQQLQVVPLDEDAAVEAAPIHTELQANGT